VIIKNKTPLVIVGSSGKESIYLTTTSTTPAVNRSTTARDRKAGVNFMEIFRLLFVFFNEYCHFSLGSAHPGAVFVLRNFWRIEIHSYHNIYLPISPSSTKTFAGQARSIAG
jgi:hypothetical protein